MLIIIVEVVCSPFFFDFNDKISPIQPVNNPKNHPVKFHKINKVNKKS